MTGKEIGELYNQRHDEYKVTVDHAKEMAVHVLGTTPKNLLELTRPNEPDHVKKYRLEIFEPITRSLSEKIVNTVNRIFNPRLYKIDWKEEPETLGKDTLKEYLLNDFPKYRNIWNFLKETFTPIDFQDPNAVMVIQPKEWDIQDNEFFEPVPKIIGSEFLIEFVDEQFYIFKFKDKVKIYDTQMIQVWEKKGDNWVVTFQYDHNFGFVPCFRLGGIVKGNIFKSFISGVLPHWNRVVTMSSDLDAQYIGHMYLQPWSYATDCVAEGCNSGRVPSEDGNWSQCEVCRGSGKVGKSPYGEITINRDALAPDSPLPIPPKGYIDVPIEIVTKAEEKIKSEEEKGFASVNMDILNQVGENQSGIAKTIDRQDLDSFLLRYSQHVFEYVLPNMIKAVSSWRYGIITDSSDLIPDITAPTEFTVLSLDFLTEEYKSASTAKVGDSYIRQIEEELTNTRFKNNEEARLKNLAIIKLNPLPNKSPDELLTIKMLLPRSESYKITMSLLISELVTMAIEQNANFLELPLEEQREIVKGLSAKEDLEVLPSPVI